MIDKHTRTFTIAPEEVVRAVTAYLCNKYPEVMEETEEFLALKSLYFEETHRANHLCSVSITVAYQKIVDDQEKKGSI